MGRGRALFFRFQAENVGDDILPLIGAEHDAAHRSPRTIL